jgi:leucyl aminopeptidase
MKLKVSVDKFLSSAKVLTEGLVISLPQLEKKGKGKNYPKTLVDLDKSFKGLLIETIEAEEFDFSAGSTLVISLSSHNKTATNVSVVKKVILIGLGEESKIDTKILRKVSASLIRSIKSSKLEKVTAVFPKNPEILAEASILISYEFDKYKTVDKAESKKTDKKDKKFTELKVLVESVDKNDKELVKQALISAEATCIARDLVWEPA